MKPVDSIFADFHNSDKEGRVRLNTAGTFEDLKLKNIVLTAGMQVMLDDHEEFNILGIVEFSETENIWVAKIDWKDLD